MSSRSEDIRAADLGISQGDLLEVFSWKKKHYFNKAHNTTQILNWQKNANNKCDSRLLHTVTAYWTCIKQQLIPSLEYKLSQSLLQCVNMSSAERQEEMLSSEISPCSLIPMNSLQRLTFTLDVLDCWFSAISTRRSRAKNTPKWRITLHLVTHPFRPKHALIDSARSVTHSTPAAEHGPRRDSVEMWEDARLWLSGNHKTSIFLIKAPPPPPTPLVILWLLVAIWQVIFHSAARGSVTQVQSHPFIPAFHSKVQNVPCSLSTVSLRWMFPLKLKGYDKSEWIHPFFSPRIIWVLIISTDKERRNPSQLIQMWLRCIILSLAPDSVTPKLSEVWMVGRQE